MAVAQQRRFLLHTDAGGVCYKIPRVHSWEDAYPDIRTMIYQISCKLQQDLLSVIGGARNCPELASASAGAETNLVGWILARVWPTMATGEIVYDGLQ